MKITHRILVTPEMSLRRKRSIRTRIRIQNQTTKKKMKRASSRNVPNVTPPRCPPVSTISCSICDFPLSHFKRRRRPAPTLPAPPRNARPPSPLPLARAAPTRYFRLRRAGSSAGEHSVHTGKVGGSIPPRPTTATVELKNVRLARLRSGQPPPSASRSRCADVRGLRRRVGGGDGAAEGLARLGDGRVYRGRPRQGRPRRDPRRRPRSGG